MVPGAAPAGLFTYDGVGYGDVTANVRSGTNRAHFGGAALARPTNEEPLP